SVAILRTLISSRRNKSLFSIVLPDLFAPWLINMNQSPLIQRLYISCCFLVYNKSTLLIHNTIQFVKVFLQLIFRITRCSFTQHRSEERRVGKEYRYLCE